MADVAKKLEATMDKYHRQKSAVFGAQAQSRAGITQPGAEVSSVATPVPQVTDNLDEVYRQTQQRLMGLL